MACTATKALNTARSQLGYAEQAGNHTKFGQWYGMDGVSWCDEFISWVAAQAGAADIIGKFAYTPSHAAWFKDNGQWGTTPRRGAIVFFDFPDSVKRIQHVGIVEKVNDDGGVTTIEGNTSSGTSGSQANGGGVYRRVRNKGVIVGYGYPAYKRESNVSPANTHSTHPPLTVDGVWGPGTTKALQRHLGVAPDGDIGPGTRKALQKALKVTVDGDWGPTTRKALQKAVGVPQDGDWGPQTIKALQRQLNTNWSA